VGIVVAVGFVVAVVVVVGEAVVVGVGSLVAVGLGVAVGSGSVVFDWNQFWLKPINTEEMIIMTMSVPAIIVLFIFTTSVTFF